MGQREKELRDQELLTNTPLNPDMPLDKFSSDSNKSEEKGDVWNEPKE